MSASQGQFSEEARSMIRSTSAISNRSARASAPGRVMRLKHMDGNNSRGSSGRLLVQSHRSSSKSQTSRSQPPRSNRPPVFFVLWLRLLPNIKRAISIYREIFCIQRSHLWSTTDPTHDARDHGWPNEFRSSRWANPSDDASMAFMPFGLGRKNCVGLP